jgi:hypothetical protein
LRKPKKKNIYKIKKILLPEAAHATHNDEVDDRFEGLHGMEPDVELEAFLCVRTDSIKIVCQRYFEVLVDLKLDLWRNVAELKCKRIGVTTFWR